jgi:hypothetical protein
VIGIVLGAFLAGGCGGSDNCIPEGGACGQGASLDCCSGYVCYFDGNFEYCAHPTLTVRPTDR